MKIMWIKINAFIFSRPRLFLFCLAYFYVVLAGILIQLVFLPYIAPPSMNAGNGLLIGFDGLKFHTYTVEAPTRIKEIGWSAWSLKPEKQIFSGIASIFYTLISPKPRALYL
jgi:hypothetical protein